MFHMQMTPATCQRCCSGWRRTAARCGPTRRLYCAAYECRTHPVTRFTRRGPRLRPAPAAMPPRLPRLPHRHRRRSRPEAATTCASFRTRIKNSSSPDTTRVCTRVGALAEMLLLLLQLQLQLIERRAPTALSRRLQMLLLSVPPVPLARRQLHPNLLSLRLGKTIVTPPTPADQPTRLAPLLLAFRTARPPRHQKYSPNPIRTLAHSLSLSTAASQV